MKQLVEWWKHSKQQAQILRQVRAKSSSMRLSTLGLSLRRPRARVFNPSLSLYLSLPRCLPACLSVWLFVCLSVWLSVCLFVVLSSPRAGNFKCMLGFLWFAPALAWAIVRTGLVSQTFNIRELPCCIPKSVSEKGKLQTSPILQALLQSSLMK